MKKFFYILIAVGFLLLLGTAGASDFNTIDFKTVVFHALIGIGLLTIGYRGVGGVNRASRR